MSRTPRVLKANDGETMPLNAQRTAPAYAPAPSNDLPPKPLIAASISPKHVRVALDPTTLAAQRKLQWACVCSILFMVAEVIGGFLAGSLAIMTDAAHLLSDVGGFCISLAAIWMQTLPSSAKLSFGFQRAEVIGAVTSVLVIWVLTGVLVYAAIERLIECLQPNAVQRVDGKLMFIVACIGLVVNIVLMQILGHDHGGHGHSHGHGHGEVEHRHHDEKHELSTTVSTSSHDHEHGHDHEHNDLEAGAALVRHEAETAAAKTQTQKQKKRSLENLNVEAAYIHALGDFIQSIGVCIAGALIWYKPEWQMADPIATFLFSIMVLATTIGIVKSSVHVLMEGTPEGINAEEIEQALCACPSVVAVHDLHIWSLRAGMPSLSVHLISDDADTALHAAQDYLMSKGIVHTTIQVERPTRLYPRNCNHLTCGQISPGQNSPQNSQSDHH